MVDFVGCRAEEERHADLEKRDALAGRLKEKDKEKMRKIMEKSDKKVGHTQFYMNGL